MIEIRGVGEPRVGCARQSVAKRRLPWGVLPVTIVAVVAAMVPAAPAEALQEDAESPAPDTAVSVEFPSFVEELDRIVAVVGDTAILMSDLRITLYQLQARGARLPAESSPQWMQFAGEVLNAMVDDLIFLQQAKIAGATAGEDRVEERADQLFEERRSAFSSDEEMMLAVEEAGMNMLQYRNMIRGQASADVLRQVYRVELEARSDLPPVIVSEEEIEAAFEGYAENQPPRPALVSFNRLVVTPSASGEALDSTLARTLEIQVELASGEDFSVIARRYSDDEGTREQGGELGWMSRDLLVKPFGDAAWGARPGATIGPVQTQFGLHFIKIERQRGSERFLRHLLLRPEIKPEDLRRRGRSRSRSPTACAPASIPSASRRGSAAAWRTRISASTTCRSATSCASSRARRTPASTGPRRGRSTGRWTWSGAGRPSSASSTSSPTGPRARSNSTTCATRSGRTSGRASRSTSSSRRCARTPMSI